ncbi:MAG: protein translocase subunit SecF [Candidatus Kerfeldbacteria bacterium CG_4_10_14_0_8_um_filter_42_10]|uniref:Protein-export membrane protein SecF n=1 Tax=Candidatus Kerfeldbacteria bacterium CG_4_10_14_0_8_um_filter_42_10 TaxID=2014248 RepID=A0A2M7RGW2_9BACT|nr:MAG: protein translocase subunit SecF [Candidatus Kerfeldbacteria bacterium CG_4_10_14_0_8_um_filter_42_10]
MYNIVGTSKIWFIISLILIAASIYFIAVGGLRLGIDFTGGSLLQVDFETERPTIQDIETALSDLNLNEVTIQPASDSEAIIRMQNVDNETRNEILNLLNNRFGAVSEISFENVGPSIGKELQQKAITAIILVLIAITAYISWAFRKVSSGQVSSYVFGIAAIVALTHDVLIVIGTFAFLGYFYQVDIGLLFVTALLTILGFSVHDTIVVFDRIRENLLRSYQLEFKDIINKAINETIIRSLNTSLTALLVLVALYLFGGESIKYFVLALIIGIITGTYSSIFIASPILIYWTQFKKNR